MNWKSFLYFEKKDKMAIIILFILIVISGFIYFLTENIHHKQTISLDESNEVIDEFRASLQTAPKKDDNKQRGAQSRRNMAYPYIKKLERGEIIELNNADTTALKKIPGIGSGYANRIVKYRNLLGGFYEIGQLKEVWGMDEDLYNKIFPYVTIEPKTKRIKVNSIEFEELRKHPYIDYKQAKVIVDIRERKGQIESVERLSLLDEFSDKDLKRLSHYLSFQ